MTRAGVVTLGETMGLLTADSLGPLQHAATMTVGIGGAESNTAIALRRLGVPVAWIGRVGADSFGDLVVRELAAEGIDLRVQRDRARPTGLMVKERRTGHATRVWYHRRDSAGAALRPGDVPPDLIAGAAALHVTGITPALSETAMATVRHAVAVARANGTPVSLDLNYRSQLWDRATAGAVLAELVRAADIVFAGHDEATLVVPPHEDPLELAEALAALGPRHALVKRGEHGTAAVIDGEQYAQPAVPVPVVDTVGAGDAFVAGYLADLIEGAPPAVRLRTAVTAGAFACTVPGDWEGLPRRDELDLLDVAEGVIR